MKSIVFTVLAVLAWPAVAAAESPWTWPVAAPHVVAREFDKPAQNWLPGHRGVDLSTAPGSPVFAAGDGRIAFAGEVGGKPVVSVHHENGLRTTYEPVTSTVEVDASVVVGQQIGVVVAGHPECATDSCLHWGLRRGDEYLDPLWLLTPRQLRLKPL